MRLLTIAVASLYLPTRQPKSLIVDRGRGLSGLVGGPGVSPQRRVVR